MLLTRRLPRLLYTYRYSVYFTIIMFSAIVYFLFKWNVLCVNLQAWQHVKRMCHLYEQGQIIGSLCAPLCISQDIHSLTCHSFQATKEAVFSAEWHNIRLVFKSVSKDVPTIHWYENGLLKYPTERQFLSTIRTIVKRKLNLTLAYDTAIRLSRLKPTYEEKDIRKRQMEMDNLWYFLQDNEYLLSTIFTDKDIFPQLIGTCGPYFAVEYLEPAQLHGSSSSSLLRPSAMTSSFLSLTIGGGDSRIEWGERLKFAVQILELVDELDSSFREPFHLCNIKLQHFGYINDRKKLKFLDLDEIFPRSIINSYFKEMDSCRIDEDCEFLDCRSTCDTNIGRCRNAISNNNLQVICEKIFLGWRMSNTIIVPGLLMSQHTPSELASILRQCAKPLNENGNVGKMPNEEIKKRLYNVLYEVEQSVNKVDFSL